MSRNNFKQNKTNNVRFKSIDRNSIYNNSSFKNEKSLDCDNTLLCIMKINYNYRNDNNKKKPVAKNIKMKKEETILNEDYYNEINKVIRTNNFESIKANHKIFSNSNEKEKSNKVHISSQISNINIKMNKKDNYFSVDGRKEIISPEIGEAGIY